MSNQVKTSPGSAFLQRKLADVSRRRAELAQSAQDQYSQLPIWPDAVRCLPNEVLRSALFNAQNNKKVRQYLDRAQIAVIGDGYVTYTGMELRQIDELVWLQLVHLAREHPAGNFVEFTPHAFCRSIGWSTSGRDYERLRECLTRLQATSLEIGSNRLGKIGVALSMLPKFQWREGADGPSLSKYRVTIDPDLVRLFEDAQYTQMEWEQRLSLPDGIATWLHGYFASHRSPYPIKLETIAIGAGIASRGKKLRELVNRALIGLRKVGFLSEGRIDENDLVIVTRSR